MEYEAQVSCEYLDSGGDVETCEPRLNVNSVILELLSAIYPRIQDDLDFITEIRIKISVRER